MRNPAGGLMLAALLAAIPPAEAQTRQRKPPARPAATAPRVEPAVVRCPNVLGMGVATRRQFCDVHTGADPLGGVVVAIPPHRGPARLRFDLHNRQVVSMQQVARGRAYTRATATIGVLAMDGALLGRGVVMTEFRRVADLLDRVAAGPGQAGVKAVAPVGSEVVVVEVPEGVDEVSILGERLTAMRVDGTETVTGPGRPIAVVSNVEVEYRPGTPPRRRR